uniref:Uncharacterized protein n=1 Tax=Vitis vinifera TaxID=29760 RepID=F6HX18_VITVI
MFISNKSKIIIKSNLFQIVYVTPLTSA